MQSGQVKRGVDGSELAADGQHPAATTEPEVPGAGSGAGMEGWTGTLRGLPDVVHGHIASHLEHNTLDTLASAAW
jgi:hypothetical protein